MAKIITIYISVTSLIIFAIHNVFCIQYSWINLLLKWHLTLDCLDTFGPANKLNINYKSQTPLPNGNR